MSCDGCPLLFTGCKTTTENPCDKLSKKLRAAEKAKAEQALPKAKETGDNQG